jgi:hypothetical protein
MLHDDGLNDYLARLRPPMVSLPCPGCPAVITGLSKAHAGDLLAIHQEGTCQGRREE